MCYCHLFVWKGMIANNIKTLRRRAGLSQRELAKAAETSQQQIQRIEAGVQAVRFELATKICKALGVSLADVFPSTELPLAKARKRPKKVGDLFQDDKATEELEEAGLDMDPAVWTFRYRLRGGHEGDLGIAGTDRRRVMRILHGNEEHDTFIVFDAENRRYAFNPEHLLSVHFLFDPPAQSHDAPDDFADEEHAFVVRFHMADGGEPMEFDVEPDSAVMDEETDSRQVQMQELMFYAELGDQCRLSFEDVDGERVYQRIKDIAMFSVPLRALEPALLDADDDDE